MPDISGGFKLKRVMSWQKCRKSLRCRYLLFINYMSSRKNILIGYSYN
jgi:hypothetical protein